MQDPIPLLAKFGAVYSRPGHRVLISPKGDMLVRPAPLELKLSTAGINPPSVNQRLLLLVQTCHTLAHNLATSKLWHSKAQLVGLPLHCNHCHLLTCIECLSRCCLCLIAATGIGQALTDTAKQVFDSAVVCCAVGQACYEVPGERMNQFCNLH